jgi:hypothetical protein
MPTPTADALRVNALLRTHGSPHRVADELGVSVQSIVDILLDPTKTLSLPTGGGSGDRAVWKPPYGSLKAAVQDPALAVSKGGLNLSTLYLSRIYVADPIDVTKVHWILTAQGTGLTFAELGLYNSSLQLLGKTGDVHTKFDGSATTAPQNATLNPVAGRSLHIGGEGQWVYVGHYQLGGTARAQLAGWTLPSGVAALDGQPPRAASRLSTNALPDPIDPFDIAPGGSTVFIWYGLS